MIAALPAELAALAAEHGVVDAWPLSTRASFRLRRADGTQCKGRLLRESAPLPLLDGLPDHPGFARVLARRGRACLEEWIDGVSLAGTPAEPAVTGRAGGLLAWLHRQRAAGPAAVDDERAVLGAHLDELAAQGWLTAAERRKLFAVAAALTPTTNGAGLLHFDLCGENLVLHPTRGPVCIDNEHPRVGPFEADLGRTVYRWSLTGEARAAFLDGYAAAGGPGRRDELTFWVLAAEGFSAVMRLRRGRTDAGVGVQALRARLG